jgi:D-threo-aldose 1-dehydrogenase
MAKFNRSTRFAGISEPVSRVVWGTSSLGNLFQAWPPEVKLEIVQKWFDSVEGPFIIDTAGKYGAGLALEEINRCLTALHVAPEKVIVCNKLGIFPVNRPFQSDCV